MSAVLNYPSETEYTLPKKNILVISCMDLRLTDNLVDFLHFDNLHNRYDHFILAGTSLLTTSQYKADFKKGVLKKYGHWKDTLSDHIKLAKQLHKISDVYIVEHQDCGAYSGLLRSNIDLSDPLDEKNCHAKFARELADRIYDKYTLHAHCFFIDLRGNVELLYTTS